MVAVGEIQHPEHGHILRSNVLSSNASIKPSLAKLRLTFRRHVLVDRVGFYNADRLDDRTVRFQQMPGFYESKIICRGVVLPNGSVFAALEQSNRQIEAW